MKILPNLTGLRFVLALLVIIYHIPQFCENRGFSFFNDWSLFHKGQEAVYMFFSLSGFLIIGKLYVEKAISNSINLKAFFKKRVLRIFPLYYLVLSFGFIYYWLILPCFNFEYNNNYNLLYGIFLSYTFFPNIFGTYNPGGIIEILWSIGIEEQFYLLIAPLFFFISFKNIFRFLILFTALYFLIYFLGLSNFLREYKMLFFYFSMSGLFSIALINQKTWMLQFRHLIYVAFLLYFSTTIFSQKLSEVGYHLISMFLFGLTIFSLASKPITFLDNNPLNYLGKISYGIYMYHAIAMQLVGYICLQTNLNVKISSLYFVIIFNFLVVIFTIAIAAVSYRYFESYFLNLKKRK